MESIQFEDWLKCEVRKGTIEEAELVPKSKKLVKLLVTFGTGGKRTIVAGIAESFQPSDLLGRSVVAILNLQPRTMMGIESHGMLLAAKDSDGLHLVTCSGEDGNQVG